MTTASASDYSDYDYGAQHEDLYEEVLPEDYLYTEVEYADHPTFNRMNILPLQQQQQQQQQQHLQQQQHQQQQQQQEQLKPSDFISRVFSSRRHHGNNEVNTVGSDYINIEDEDKKKDDDQCIDDSWRHFQGSCYKYFSDHHLMRWRQANDKCQSVTNKKV